MAKHPAPEVLYPDVVARGSLRAALQALADEGGLSVPFTAEDPGALTYAVTESRLPHRKRLLVNSWVHKRRWSIRGEETAQGLALVQGDTDDLAQVARAAHAWHDGSALSDIRAAAPFVRLTGRFEVPDHDPVRLAESEWQHMRAEAGEQNWPAYQALVEAAYAEPALRALYPFTSHWTLRFSATTRPGLTITGPCLLALGVEEYLVSKGFTGADPLARTTTAQEAVAAAVRHLPAGLGPVASGAFDEGTGRTGPQ